MKTELATSPVPSIRPGWPLKRGVFLAIFAGAVGPLVFFVMACVVPAIVALVTLLATTAVGFSLLQRRLCSAHSIAVSGLHDVSSMVFVLAGLFSGMAGSAWCYKSHICMCGHRVHQAYPSWHTALDFAWPAALALAAVAACRRRYAGCLAVVWLAVFLVTYRFVFLSFGGIFTSLPL